MSDPNQTHEEPRSLRHEIPEATLPISKFRVFIYVFSAGWLAMLPAFDDNASHFGWGFLPLLASFIIVPVILGVLLVDSMMRTVDACVIHQVALRRRLIVAGLPITVLLSAIAWLYYLYITS